MSVAATLLLHGGLGLWLWRSAAPEPGARAQGRGLVYVTRAPSAGGGAARAPVGPQAAPEPRPSRAALHRGGRPPPTAAAALPSGEAPVSEAPGAASTRSAGAIDPSTGSKGPDAPGPGGAAPEIPGGLRCPAWAPCRPATSSGAAAASDASAAATSHQRLLARIAAHRRYPELARRQGLAGAVHLRISVLPGGEVGAIVVVRSAAPALDEAAVQAVRRAAPLPAPPGDVTVAIDFRLEPAPGALSGRPGPDP